MNNPYRISLDETISQFAYILDSLRALRDIQNMGCCNDCHNLYCEYKPDPGEIVRYNCPFYKGGKE